MSDEKQFHQIKLDLKTLVDQVGAGNADVQQRFEKVGQSLDELSGGVADLRRAVTANPNDPVARRALQQTPALANSLGDAASGLQRLVMLRQRNASDQEMAAEGLRTTGAFLEIAATAAMIAPPPYGKIAAEIISAIQGLVSFVATILDLVPSSRPEPSIADIVANVVNSAAGRAHAALLNGVVRELDHMSAALQELHAQKEDPTRQRTFDSWPAIWDLVELPAGEGVDVRVDSMPRWLMDEVNLELDPDPWGEVFYLYLLAKGQYLRNWLSAMLLLNRVDAKKPDLINGDFLVASRMLDSVLKSERSILQQLTPYAVRKTTAALIGVQGDLIVSTKGFVAEGTEWLTHRLSGAAITKIGVGGNGGRIWSLHNSEGHLYFYKLDGKGKELEFDRYPPGGTGPWGQNEGFRDMAVVSRGSRTSEIHALPKKYKGVAFYYWDEDKVGSRKPWDLSFYTKMQGDHGPRYRTNDHNGFSVYRGDASEFTQIGAAPSGALYLLKNDTKLFYWDNARKPHDSQALREIVGPTYPAKGAGRTADPRLSSGTERLHVFWDQEIRSKSHADIARDAAFGDAKPAEPTPWTKVAPPRKGPDGKAMPASWSYKSVVESEGGALLAAIELPGIGHRFYMWHDGEWEIGSSRPYGVMLITVPSDSHDTFNALKTQVNDLVAYVTAQR